MDTLITALPACLRGFVIEALAGAWTPLLPRVLSLVPHARSLEGACQALGAAGDALGQMAAALWGWL